jgi:hypothetical protein
MREMLPPRPAAAATTQLNIGNQDVDPSSVIAKLNSSPCTFGFLYDITRFT